MLSPENRFQAETLRIAREKIRTDTVGKIHRHISTGGFFDNIFLWDTAFCCLWAKYFPELFPLEDSLDNFYEFQSPDGFISREYLPCGESLWGKEHPIAFAPPLLAWAELELFHAGATGIARLKKVFPHLVKQDAFNRAHYRRPDGLYFGDPFGCGMDNLPRWPHRKPEGTGRIVFEKKHIHPSKRNELYFANLVNRPCFLWNRQSAWVDLSSQMAFNALNLGRMAELLGHDASPFFAEHAKMEEIINRRLWSESDGFYFDFADGENAPTRRFFLASYWVLMAEIVPPEWLERFLAPLTDPAHFLGVLPFRALSASDRDYHNCGGYWRGMVWAPTAYMTLCALRKCDRETLARNLAERLYDGVKAVFEATGTLWENYRPDDVSRQARHAQRDFCGWSALVPIAVAREFLNR